MGRKRESDWRDAAASRLAAKHVARVKPTGVALIMEDPREELAQALESLQVVVRRWWRRALGDRPASAWPPPGPFDLVGIRLPKAKDELSMAVHAAASCLRPGGTLLVYGAKDEGVASAARRVEPLLGPVRTLGTGGHCRILAASRPERIVGLRATLQDWRLQGEIELLGRLEPWVSYPGIFAHGRLDEGTRLLLTRLPELRDGTRALDFGCGSGPIAAACALRAREDRVDISLDGLDVDAVALEALRENVPSARPLLADGLAAVAGSYDLILSNPPYHVGKAESTEALSAFVARAPGVLAPGGRIVLVAQQRLRIEAPMRAAFPTVRVLTDDGTYRIWEGTTS